jgi:hypothetical protein
MTENATHQPITQVNLWDFLKTPPNVVKHGVEVLISRESLLMFNPELERRHTVELEPPTPEAWERYRAAKIGMEALEAYEGTEWGGPDYGTEVREPEPTRKITYTETEEEWRARCTAAGLPTSVTYTRGN